MKVERKVKVSIQILATMIIVTGANSTSDTTCMVSGLCNLDEGVLGEVLHKLNRRDIACLVCVNRGIRIIIYRNPTFQKTLQVERNLSRSVDRSCKGPIGLFYSIWPMKPSAVDTCNALSEPGNRWNFTVSEARNLGDNIHFSPPRFSVNSEQFPNVWSDYFWLSPNAKQVYFQNDSRPDNTEDSHECCSKKITTYTFDLESGRQQEMFITINLALEGPSFRYCDYETGYGLGSRCHDGIGRFVVTSFDECCELLVSDLFKQRQGVLRFDNSGRILNVQHSTTGPSRFFVYYKPNYFRRDSNQHVFSCHDTEQIVWSDKTSAYHALYTIPLTSKENHMEMFSSSDGQQIAICENVTKEHPYRPELIVCHIFENGRRRCSFEIKPQWADNHGSCDYLLSFWRNNDWCLFNPVCGLLQSIDLRGSIPVITCVWTKNILSHVASVDGQKLALELCDNGNRNKMYWHALDLAKPDIE